MARPLATVAVVFLAACGAEDDIALDLEVGAATVEHAPGELDPEDAAAELWELYQELASRLEERGVTIEELLAAAEAEDEGTILEMFGWTPEEMAAADARILDLIERARAAGVGGYPAADAVPLRGWGCEWRGTGPWAESTILMVGGIGLGAWVAGGPVIVPRAAIAVLVSAGLCLCSFDSTDPGPPARPK